MMDSARRRDDGGGPRGDRLRREISGRLVEWRKTFIASNGRNPRKDEVPKEQRALLRELTNLKRDRGVPEATAPSTREGTPDPVTDDENSDSHVSASPVRGAGRKAIIPRRSAGKLPGATNAALCPRKRRPRPCVSDAEVEAAATDDGNGREKKSARSEGTREDAEEPTPYLGSLFTKVVDILEDGPPEKAKKKSSSKGSDAPTKNLSTYRRKTRRNNIYRKRFKGSGKFSKGSKITTSNFCQVSRTGRSSRRGGRSGAKSGQTGRKRVDFVAFDTLLEGDVAPIAEAAAPESNAEGGSEGGPQGRGDDLGASVPVQELREALAKGEESEVVKESLKKVFGFASFREGQLRIIQRVVQGMSTLAIMPTGHGKSLLYQVPALALEARAPIIVISPLLALMKDQMAKLPKPISSGILCSGQTSSEALATLDKIRANKIKVVFISPERLYSKAFVRAFQAIGEPPPFVCIDEAHCISEWGHTFRPAYFRLGRILYEDLGVKTILALTATATQKSISSICKVLKLDSGSVIREMPVRHNLRLRVSELGAGEKFQDKALALLKPGGRLETSKSVIIYCNYQLETELVAAHLYTHGVLAKAYHAKMSMPERDRVQDLFCKGKIRVVAATVAFGMGLDKHDVDAIIHSEMPRSVEEYVQQIGRGGRDGREASCHMFYTQKGYRRLRSYCHSDETDESAVHSLLCKVFGGRKITTSQQGAGAEEGGPTKTIGVLPLQETSMALDLKESTIESILTFLEERSQASDQDQDQPPSGLLRMLQPLVGHVCDFVFFDSSDDLSDKFPIIRHIKALGKGQSMRGGHYTLELTKLAEESRMSLSEIQESLRTMQRTRIAECRLKDYALCYEIVRDPQNKRSLAQGLAKRLLEISREGTHRLDYLRKLVLASAQAMKQPSPSEEEAERGLKAGIRAYFETSGARDAGCCASQEENPNHKFISRDIRVFIQGNKHLLQRQKKAQGPMLTGRAIARIMQGISSPAYPAYNWARNTMWARYMDTDFEVLLKAANREMVWFLTNKM